AGRSVSMTSFVVHGLMTCASAESRRCRHLTSFPTRRSSDLGADAGRGRVVALDFLDMAPIAGVDFVQLDFLDPAAPERIKSLLGDRKSTRLNSSHVSISYAVFCLKKKSHAQPEHHVITKQAI